MADQLATTIVTGFIARDGSKISGDGDYDVVKANRGLYNIVFRPPFAVTPVVVATQVFPNDVNNQGGSTRDNAVIVGITERQFRVKVGNGNGDPEDRDFTFIATGVGLSGAALAAWEAEEHRLPDVDAADEA